MGIICVTRTRAQVLTFSLFEGKKVDKVQVWAYQRTLAAIRFRLDATHEDHCALTVVQVFCEAVDDPAVFDPLSVDFDPDAGWKRPSSAAIAWRNVDEISKRDLAEKFARSGINFSLLFVNREKLQAQNVRGASVDAICKLFEASDAVGGATVRPVVPFILTHHLSTLKPLHTPSRLNG